MLKNQQGIILIDALIALFILAAGMLALLKLESNLIASNTLSKMRVNASFLATQLINTAYADNGNAACYTLPVANQSGCVSLDSSNYTSNWFNEVGGALPGASSHAPTSILNADGSLTVTIFWQSAQGTVHSFTSTGQVQ